MSLNSISYITASVTSDLLHANTAMVSIVPLFDHHIRYALLEFSSSINQMQPQLSQRRSLWMLAVTWASKMAQFTVFNWWILWNCLKNSCLMEITDEYSLKSLFELLQVVQQVCRWDGQIYNVPVSLCERYYAADIKKAIDFHWVIKKNKMASFGIPGSFLHVITVNDTVWMVLIGCVRSFSVHSTPCIC